MSEVAKTKPLADMSVVEVYEEYARQSGTTDFPLEAIQVVPITDGGKRVARIWFNDGHIREHDFKPYLSTHSINGRSFLDEETFRSSLSVFCGAVGFDLTGNRSEWECWDFEPHDLWLDSVDITDQVLAQERKDEEALADMN